MSLLLGKGHKVENGEKNVHTVIVSDIIQQVSDISLLPFILVVIICYKAIFGDGMF